MKYASYESMRQCDSVVVLGAGPSINDNIDLIKKWKEQNRALVIVSNYVYPMLADYTVFVSRKIFRSYSKKSDGQLIIAPWIYDRLGNKDKEALSGDTLVINCSTKGIQEVSQIKIKKNGCIPFDPASSGFAAILLASFCKPQKLLIAGFDGIKRHKDKKITQKYFHGKHRKLKEYTLRIRMHRLYKRYFSKQLIPYVVSQGTEIYACSSDRLRGINPKATGIQIL